MTTTCTTCGEPIDDGDLRCPTCGALASPTEDDSTDVAPAGDPPPWSIPIREPAVAPAADARARRGVPVLPVALVGVVLLVVLAVVVGGRLLDGDTASSTAGVVDEDQDAAPAAGFDAASITTTTTEATTTTSAPTTTAAPAETESSTTAAPATTAAPTTTVAVRTAPNGTGSVPALSTSFRGWLAQLRSVPYEAGTRALAEEWERTRDVAPGVVALRSDDWAGLGDGFWVLVDPGPFDSAEGVRSFCASIGLDDEGACLARELRG